jgi:hypothetical protein
LEGLVSVVSTAYCVGLAQVSYAIRINMKNGMQPMHLPGKNGELNTPAKSYAKQFNSQMIIEIIWIGHRKSDVGWNESEERIPHEKFHLSFQKMAGCPGIPHIFFPARRHPWSASKQRIEGNNVGLHLRHLVSFE